MSEKRNLRGFWPGFLTGFLALPAVIVIILMCGSMFSSTPEYGFTTTDEYKEKRVRNMWDSMNRLELATGVIFPEYTIDSVDVRELPDGYTPDICMDYSLVISFDAPFSKKTLNAINEKLEKEPVETKSETTEEGYPLHSSTKGWERLEDGRIKFSDATTKGNGGHEDTFVTIDIKQKKAIIDYTHIKY